MVTEIVTTISPRVAWIIMKNYKGAGEYVSLPKEMSASSVEELMLCHCFRIRRI